MKSLQVLVAALALVLAAMHAAAATRSVIRLAVTSTTDNTGLIAHLVPAFEQSHPYDLRVVAGGTGRALKLLANGDVDIAITHAENMERQLLQQGAALNRMPIMYNDFVIVGPREDGAKVARSISAGDAFKRIHDSAALFVSRGDESGTHARERRIWRVSGTRPAGQRYLETGQGMGKTLQMAGELDAYTLVDRGTWLRFKDASTLRLHYQGDEMLFNVYSALSADPKRHTDTNRKGAADLTRWLRSPQCVALIRSFRIEEQALFVPYLASP